MQESRVMCSCVICGARAFADQLLMLISIWAVSGGPVIGGEPGVDGLDSGGLVGGQVNEAQ
jgi:hypothetical protein